MVKATRGDGSNIVALAATLWRWQ